MNRLPENGGILLQKAREDAQMAQTLLDAGSAAWGPAFHAQQSVEKAIKAVLAYHGIVFPYSHDLELLIALLREHGLPLPPNADELPRLSPFGALTRYSGALGEDHPVPDREWLLEAVRRTLDWAEGAKGSK